MRVSATRALAAALLVALACAGEAAAHSRLGPYQNMATAARDWQTPYRLARGVPMVDYGAFEARNPVATAQYGLASWSLWKRYGEPYRLRAALRVSDFLVSTQRAGGVWTYGFDYASPGTDMALTAPWSSALAQGQGISLLRRAYAHTGRTRYLRAARRALAPLGRAVADGGLTRRHDGGIAFEEYPSERPSLPLNGHLQTLVGLWDLSDVSPRAAELFRRGVRTAARIVGEYDAGDGSSLYNLAHEVGFAPVHAPPAYHAAHVRLLGLVDRLSPHRAFRRWARHWKPRAVAVPATRLPPTARP